MLEVFTRISTESGKFSTKGANLSTKRQVQCIADPASDCFTSTIDSDRSGPQAQGATEGKPGRAGSPGRQNQRRAGRTRPSRKGRDRKARLKGRTRKGSEPDSQTFWRDRTTSLEVGKRKRRLQCRPGFALASVPGPGCAEGGGLKTATGSNTAARLQIPPGRWDGRLVLLGPVANRFIKMRELCAPTGRACEALWHMGIAPRVHRLTPMLSSLR